MSQINCWEHQRCGKERSCPAFPHHGRICFSVTGTVCKDKVQGTYQDKIKNCRELCSFYREELIA